MSLSVFVIADILHLIKIIFLCDKLFMFKKRENKQKILMMIVATMSCISIGIYLGDNDGIETIIYIVSICIMLSVKVMFYGS